MADIDKIRIPSTSKDYVVKSANMMKYIDISKSSTTEEADIFVLNKQKHYNVLNYKGVTKSKCIIQIPTMIDGEVICTHIPLTHTSDISVGFENKEEIISNVNAIQVTTNSDDIKEKLLKVYILKTKNKYIVVK